MYIKCRQSTRDDSYSQNSASTAATAAAAATTCSAVEPKKNSSTNNTADSQTSHNFETTFDVEGNIETRSTSSQGNKEDSHSQRSIGSGSKDGNRYFCVGFFAFFYRSFQFHFIRVRTRTGGLMKNKTNPINCLRILCNEERNNVSAGSEVQRIIVQVRTPYCRRFWKSKKKLKRRY